MKLGFLAAIVLSVTAPHAEAKDAHQVGRLVMSHCQSNGSPFTQDDCRNESRLGSCSVLSSGRKISLSGKGLSLSAGIEDPYQYGNGESRHNLKLRGLTRGSVILDASGIRAKRVEVYKNLDRSGERYIRYTCSDLVSSTRRASDDGEALKAIPSVLRVSPEKASCEGSIAI